MREVIIFRLEMWVMTPCMGQDLWGLKHRVSRWITGMQSNKQVDGSWDYLPLETTMEKEGFEEMG